MKVEFYKEINGKELIVSMNLPLDEISIYSDLIKEKLEKEIENNNKKKLITVSEDVLDEDYKVIRKVTIRPMRPHNAKD